MLVEFFLYLSLQLRVIPMEEKKEGGTPEPVPSTSGLQIALIPKMTLIPSFADFKLPPMPEAILIQSSSSLQLPPLPEMALIPAMMHAPVAAPVAPVTTEKIRLRVVGQDSYEIDFE